MSCGSLEGSDPRSRFRQGGGPVGACGGMNPPQAGQEHPGLDLHLRPTRESAAAARSGQTDCWETLKPTCIPLQLKHASTPKQLRLPQEYRAQIAKFAAYHQRHRRRLPFLVWRDASVPHYNTATGAPCACCGVLGRCACDCLGCVHRSSCKLRHRYSLLHFVKC